MNDHLEPTDHASQPGSAPAPVPGVSEAHSPKPILENAGATPIRVAVRNGPRNVIRPPAKRPMAPGRRPANGPGRASRPPGPTRPAAPKRPPQTGGNTPRPAHPPKHHGTPVDEADDSFMARHLAKLIVAVIVLVVGGGVYFVKTSKPAAASKAPEVVKISLPPPQRPPPPPPPPPRVPPPPQKEDKMQAVQAEDKTPDPPKPVDAPAPTLGTNLKGDGEGMSGLGGSGNGGGLGTIGGSGGSRVGYFASQVQKGVADALRRNSKTRKASMSIKVRIWVDKQTGRVTSVKLDGNTLDQSLAAAVNEAIGSVQLQSTPPPEMRMPIVMQLTARRPNP